MKGREAGRNTSVTMSQLIEVLEHICVAKEIGLLIYNLFVDWQDFI